MHSKHGYFAITPEARLMSTSTSKSILKGEVESSRKQGLESDEDGDEDEEVPPHQLRGGLYSFTQTKHSVYMNKLNPNQMSFFYSYFMHSFWSLIIVQLVLCH